MMKPIEFKENGSLSLDSIVEYDAITEKLTINVKYFIDDLTHKEEETLLITDTRDLVRRSSVQKMLEEMIKEIKPHRMGDSDYGLWLHMEGYNQALSQALEKIKTI